MSSLCRASLFLAALLFSATAQAASFTVCAEPWNLPFSASDGRGFEIEAARLLASDMGRDFHVVYIAQRTPDFLRTTINSGRCDAMMSVPAGSQRLATTKPWYRSAYLAVSRSGAEVKLATLDDAGLQELRIGVAGQGTPPALVLARRGRIQNMRSYSVFDSERLVEDVREDVLDIAYVWGPFAGWYASQKQGLAVSALPPSDSGTPLAFALSIGVRTGNDALLSELDKAIDRNATALAAILDRWHVPREGN
jgi:mxaJ protein